MPSRGRFSRAIPRSPLVNQQRSSGRVGIIENYLDPNVVDKKGWLNYA